MNEHFDIIVRMVNQKTSDCLRHFNFLLFYAVIW